MLAPSRHLNSLCSLFRRRLRWEVPPGQAIHIPGPRVAAVAAGAPPTMPRAPAELKQPGAWSCMWSAFSVTALCRFARPRPARVRQAAAAAVCRRTAGYPAGVAPQGSSVARSACGGEPVSVRPDGTIGLGVYGNVYVAGLTLDEARDAIANQLHVRLDNKSVETIKKSLVVDVSAYNSKVYYVITDGGGYGEQVYPIPVTGNEHVLDAQATINGLPAVSSKKRVWIARATPGCTNPNILPVDWCGITKKGFAATNYQVFPNDRIYVGSKKPIQADSRLAKRLNPIDRVLVNFVFLSSSTVNSIKNPGSSNNGNGTVP